MIEWNSQRFGRKFKAIWEETKKTRRICALCGGWVHRSWLTGILHSCCRACRQLILTYGPNITVRKVKP